MTAPLQYALPFSLKDAISVTRVATILGVGRDTVYRMVTEYGVLEYMQRSKSGIYLIRYSTLIGYCDDLRKTFGLPDRRPPLSNPLFRHADRDIPPWPLVDNLSTPEVMQSLQLEKTRVVRMAELQHLEAYQLLPGAPWRFRRQSLEGYLAKLNERNKPRSPMRWGT